MQQKNTIGKGEYDVIYADPPWSYLNKFGSWCGKHGVIKAVNEYYNTMPLQDIKKLKIPSKKDSWLFLWATATNLPEAIEVLNTWGYKYRTCAIWNKMELGLGWFFRIQHEILLVGIKGKPPIPKIKPRSIFNEKRTIHSKKPKIIRGYLNKAFPDLSKIELFSRDKIEGWDSWGNEVPKEEQKTIGDGKKWKK